MAGLFLGKSRFPAPKVPWKIRDTIAVFVAAWLGAELALIAILSILGRDLAWAKTALNALTSGNIFGSFLGYLLSAFVGLGLVQYFVRRSQAQLSDLGLRRFNPIEATIMILAIYVAFSVGIGLLFVVLTVAFPSFDANQPQSNDFTVASTGLAAQISLLALVLIPAVLEEVVFRGFMFAAMATRWGVVLGALGSSALFALAHGQWNAIVYTLVLGLLLCWMYRRLGSIWPGMILHAINNYIAFVALAHK